MLVLVTSVFLGRVFCSYVCPFGGMQMMADKAMNKKLKPIKWLRNFRMVLNTIWGGSLFVIGIVNGLSGLEWDLFYNLETYVSIESFGDLIRYYIIMLTILSFSIGFGKNGGCHYGCPMSVMPIVGTAVGHFLRIKSLKVAKTDQACIDCEQCNKACPMSLDVSGLVKKDSMYHMECINCGECESACPKSCISYKFQ